MEWTYLGEPFTDPPSGIIGFIYLIHCTPTGRKYIGKKLLTFAKTKQVKGKKKKIRVESDWRDYWSSSDELKADVAAMGKENFTREVIHLCKTKGMMNYLEAKEQFANCVLESDAYYNSNIMCRLHRTHVKLPV